MKKVEISENSHVSVIVNMGIMYKKPCYEQLFFMPECLLFARDSSNASSVQAILSKNQGKKNEQWSQALNLAAYHVTWHGATKWKRERETEREKEWARERERAIPP